MLWAKFNYCSYYSGIVWIEQMNRKDDATLEFQRTEMVNRNMIKTWILRRHHMSNGCIRIIIVSSLLIIGCMARGPHHPGGGVNKATHQKHINEHLNIDVKYVLYFYCPYVDL